MTDKLPLVVDPELKQLREMSADESLPTEVLANALMLSLTGLSTADAGVVAATDNLLQAIGKVQGQINNKVAKDGAKVLSDNNFTNAERVKLANIAEQATKNATDAALRDRTTHTGAQAISTVTGLQTALDAKATQTALNDLAAASVAQTNVGSAPNELPSNQHLGALAFLDTLGATQVTQHTRDSQPGDVWHEWVSNTQLRKKFHGLDGVIRTITETYA